jgi:hypothetical protein
MMSNLNSTPNQWIYLGYGGIATSIQSTEGIIRQGCYGNSYWGLESWCLANKPLDNSSKIYKSTQCPYDGQKKLYVYQFYSSTDYLKTPMGLTLNSSLMSGQLFYIDANRDAHRIHTLSDLLEYNKITQPYGRFRCVLLTDVSIPDYNEDDTTFHGVEIWGDNPNLEDLGGELYFSHLH